MVKPSGKNDPYQLHRVALSPLLPNASEADISRACRKLSAFDETQFSNFLLQQGLAPMWDKMLESYDGAYQPAESFKQTLHQARLINTGNYLLQRHNITVIRNILDQEKIPHAAYKGAHIREQYYATPALRPAVDIDVLVSAQQKIAAISAFKQQGFELHTFADIVSHEVSLIKGKTSIDLHWDILRPGRTRSCMVDTLLETRIDYTSHWGMDNESSLFIMLVHPVFAKYGTAPNASLMRVIDLALLLAKNNINWQTVYQLLSIAGLQTAAWITLEWYEMLTDHRPHAEFMSSIKPGKLRQKYLNYWLKKNFSSRLFEKPVYVQLGFTLPAHDRWADAFRAVQQARKLRKSQETDLNTLLESTRIL